MEVIAHRPVYRLSAQLEIDPRHGCLRRQGEEQYLRQQAFDLLLYLVEQRDRAVSKDELNQRIWKGTAVTDSALAQCIFEIRKALGDDSREPRFIRTIPKLGYRFIGCIEEQGSTATALAPREPSPLTQQEGMHPVGRFAPMHGDYATLRLPRSVPSRLLVACLAAAVSFLCSGLFWVLSRPATTEASMLAGGFENAGFPEQSGTFTATFDAAPSDFPINSTMGLANKQVMASKAMAVIVRFSPEGNIDARDGKSYAADSTIPYAAGVRHHFRLVVNVPAHTYSAYVTSAGGVEQTVGTNFAFRDQQNTVTDLNSIGVWSSSGLNTVCNFIIVNDTPARGLSGLLKSALMRVWHRSSNPSKITTPCT